MQKGRGDTTVAQQEGSPRGLAATAEPPYTRHMKLVVGMGLVACVCVTVACGDDDTTSTGNTGNSGDGGAATAASTGGGGTSTTASTGGAGGTGGTGGTGGAGGMGTACVDYQIEQVCLWSTDALNLTTELVPLSPSQQELTTAWVPVPNEYHELEVSAVIFPPTETSTDWVRLATTPGVPVRLAFWEDEPTIAEPKTFTVRPFDGTTELTVTTSVETCLATQFSQRQHTFTPTSSTTDVEISMHHTFSSGETIGDSQYGHIVATCE